MKIAKVFDCFMSSGKSATVYFQVRLVSSPKDVVRIFGISDTFSFSYGCWGNWGISCSLFSSVSHLDNFAAY